MSVISSCFDIEENGRDLKFENPRFKSAMVRKSHITNENMMSLEMDLREKIGMRDLITDKHLRHFIYKRQKHHNQC